MYHSFFSRCKFKECTEVFDADNFSFQNLSCFEICYDNVDQLLRFFHALSICSADRYGTVVCDVDLHACLLDDRVDCLSTLSDYIADLLWIDLHLNDLWSKFSNLCSWSIDCFIHNFINDVKSCFSCLSDSFFNNWSCQSMDLDIHLDRCDTFVCTGYLEVHISEEVFESLNICKYKIIIICITCNQST